MTTRERLGPLARLRARLSTSPTRRRDPHRTSTILSCCAVTAMSPLLIDYVIRPGDTVSGIAVEHDTTVNRIVDLNDLPAGGDLIYAGDTLKIPAAHRRGHRPSPAARSTPSSTTRDTDDDRRRIEWHRVRPGDTMIDIAERYHAWTDELIAANGGSDSLVVGQRVKVPVVVARAGGDRRTPDSSRSVSTHEQRRLEGRLSNYADPRRAKVRRMIVRTAEREGVDPDLALAVSWQEAGWQQHHVSPDSAIGAMQVIPSTGDWVSDMIGRDLNLLDVRDNVRAGVTLLGYLTDVAHTRHAVAGYYQGLAGVREDGMYTDTEKYVHNVLSLKHAFDNGEYPV